MLLALARVSHAIDPGMPDVPPRGGRGLASVPCGAWPGPTHQCRPWVQRVRVHPLLRAMNQAVPGAFRAPRTRSVGRLRDLHLGLAALGRPSRQCRVPAAVGQLRRVHLHRPCLLGYPNGGDETAGPQAKEPDAAEGRQVVRPDWPSRSARVSTLPGYAAPALPMHQA